MREGGNTVPRSTLERAATELGTNIALLAEASPRGLKAGARQLGCSVSSRSDAAIVREFAFVMLNIVDRVAYSKIGAKRDAFMDSVAEAVLLGLMGGSKSAAAHDDLLNALNDSAVFYAPLRTSSPPGTSSAGTVWWEFGKRVCRAIGHAPDIMLIDQAASMLHEYLAQLNIPSTCLT